MLPAAATLGNLLCGFGAVFYCLLSIRDEYHSVPSRLIHPHLATLLPTHVAVGCYLIVAAMIFDALDGRLARLTRKVSEFGAQLDSLADVVSFGVAPIMLFMTLLMRLAVPADGEPLVSRILWRFSMIGGVVYVSCAAIRLARYNAENVKHESAQKKFSGLPAPGAAAAFVSLLLLHEDLAHPAWAYFGVDWAYVLRWLIPLAALGLGMLMVSRIDYVHVFNVYVRRKHPPTDLVWFLIILGVGWFSPQVMLVLAAFTYVLSGPILGWRSAKAIVAARTASPPIEV